MLGERHRVWLLVSGTSGGNEGAATAERLSKKERIHKFGEVFTPEWVVRDMCDMLEAESHGAFEPGRTFLEPSCGEGAFVVEILRRKFGRCKCRADYRTALESVYGFELQPENVEATIRNVTALCREYFKPTREELAIIDDHVILCDGLKVMKLLARMDEIQS